MSKSSISKGFTLVELLVGLLITVILSAIIYLLYNTVISLVEFQSRSEEKIHRSSEMLDQLATDLNQLVKAEEFRECKFTFVENPNHPGSTKLSFCILQHIRGMDSLQWGELVKVHYELLEKDGAITLSRSHQALLGPEALMPPRTNRFSEAISSFNISTLKNNKRVENWGLEEKNNPLTIKCEIKSSHAKEKEELELIIPSSLMFKSAVERGSIEKL